MHNLFVIVVAYKGFQWYDRCFSSLRQSTLAVQTIVVDNASNDGSVDYIRTNYPEIHLIESRENLGFGRANNIAMRYALDQGCDYVFLLNQDAWVEPDTLEKLVAIHHRYPEYGLLSPMHLNEGKDKIEKGLINYLDDKDITDKSLFDDLYFNRLKEVYRTNYVNAAAWLLPSETLETIGGFDPIFMHYGEDDNYLQRVLYHKKKVGICPACVVVHDTERRIKAGNCNKQTRDKVFLAELTDVTMPMNWKKVCLYHFRKMLLGLLGCNLQKMRFHRDRLQFVCKNKTSILKSRKQNVVVGPNWL